MSESDYTPAEGRARLAIDDKLTAAGWVVQTRPKMLYEGAGQAVREFILKDDDDEPPTTLWRLQQMPPLITDNLWSNQERAIRKLEASLAEGRRRALIQMATGSGKTFTAANISYRLIKHARFNRILFLVDRANLGRQTKTEFDNFVTPDDGRKFSELYNVQHLTHNKVDHVSRVTISTIQRIYSILDRKPGREQPWTTSLWIYDLRTNQHFTLKQNPLSYEALPPPAVIAAEIAEDLEAALAQFAEIAASLGGEVDETD